MLVDLTFSTFLTTFLTCSSNGFAIGRHRSHTVIAIAESNSRMAATVRQSLLS
jgi:hypothetical protein